MLTNNMPHKDKVFLGDWNCQVVVPLSERWLDKGSPPYERIHPFQQKDIQPYMRTILFDWMTEVSAALGCSRRTHQMGIDFVDRILSRTEDISRNQLQLLGTSCLFIAIKLEEYQNPGCEIMASLTAGLHTAADIRSMELFIVKTLQADLLPDVPCDFVRKYFSQHGLHNAGYREDGVYLSLPQIIEAAAVYREHHLLQDDFAKICQIIDVAMLDIDSLQFTYQQIAYSAIMLLRGNEDFDIEQFRDCVTWIKPKVEHLLQGTRSFKILFAPNSSCHYANHFPQIQTHVSFE